MASSLAHRRPEFPLAVVVAVALVVAAIRFPLHDILRARDASVTFYPAGIVCALYGELFVGLMAASLWAMLAAFIAFPIGPIHRGKGLGPPPARRGEGRGGSSRSGAALTLTIASRLFAMTALALLLALVPCRAVLGAAHEKTQSTKASIPQDLGVQDVDRVVAGLSDEQARAALRERLSADAARRQEADRKSPTTSRRFAGMIAQLRENGARLGQEWPSFLEELRRATERLAVGSPGLAFLLVGVAGILLVASAAESLFLAKARRTFAPFHGTANDACDERSPIGAGLISLSGLLVFSILAFSLFAVGIPAKTPAYGALTILFSCALLLKAFAVLLDIALSPRKSRRRLIPVGAAGAASLKNTLLTFGAFFLLGRAAWEILAEEGMPESGVMLFQIATAVVFLLALVGLALWKRKAVAAWLADRCAEDRPARLGGFGPLWHVFAILYLSAVFLAWLALLLIRGPYGPHNVFLFSMLAIPAFILLDKLAMALLTGLFLVFREAAAGRPGEDLQILDEDELLEARNTAESAGPEAAGAKEREKEELAEAKRALRSSPAFIALAWLTRLLLVVFLAFLLLHLWGLAPPLGSAFVFVFAKSLAILLIAFAVWDLARRSLQRRRLAAGAGGGNSARIRTLLPLLQKTIGIFIVVTAALMVISQAGVDIGPLLASAGVFGLALGLGMQTLVKDVVSGVFFLLDDSIRAGDYIQIGKTEGTVMKMSLRTLTMRHARGYMMVMPYGDVKDVVNYSRGPIIEKLKIPMPLDTNPRKFKKIVRQVSEDLLADEEFKDLLLRPVKSQGIKRVSDSALEFGVKFTARPGAQFLVKREVYNRLYAAFKEKGLTFAVPGVVIYGSGAGGESEAAAAKAMMQRKAAQKPPEDASEEGSG